jgi:hypothetical protein
MRNLQKQDCGRKIEVYARKGTLRQLLTTRSPGRYLPEREFLQVRGLQDNYTQAFNVSPSEER